MTGMGRRKLGGLLLAALLIGTCVGVTRPGPGPGEILLTVGEEDLIVEVAATILERERGLMYRESLGEDRGMIFVFPVDRELSFWMKNTRIPLSIAYIRSDGEILDIQKMEPMALRSHISGEPARYALEVNQGWFDRHGVAVGDRVEGLPPSEPSERDD